MDDLWCGRPQRHCQRTKTMHNNQVPEDGEYVKSLTCECDAVIIEDEIVTDGDKVTCGCGAVYQFSWEGMNVTVNR
jgi:hypothetical protein